MSGVTPAHLCLDDVPGVPQANVIFWVVEDQALLQILLGILSHLETKETPWLDSSVWRHWWSKNWAMAVIIVFIVEYVGGECF